MKSKIILGVVAVLLLILSYTLTKDSVPSDDGLNSVTDIKTSNSDLNNHKIIITKDGFTPKELKINKGDMVTFINEDSEPHWPASAYHPTHTAYPGSSIEKCNTEEEKMIFDSCLGLKYQESYSFVFNEVGEWWYHDHINATLFGKIIVVDNNMEDVKIFPGNDVNYVNNDTDTTGYLIKPTSEGKKPALILIHEWWGLNDNIKKLAGDFADMGYVVLAVDLYSGQSTSTPDEARALAGRVSADENKAFTNLKSAVAYLKSIVDVDSEKIGSVGWCFGGGWAYKMAQENLGTKASVMYYGRFNPDDDLEMMKSSILGHFGEEDVSISIDSVKEFQAKLETLSGPHEVYIYPNVGHAFANEDGDNYNKEAADLAWMRTIEFLSGILKN